MVEGLFLVRRTSQGVNDDRNQVRAVLINNDDGDADAVIIANAIAALNAAQPVGDGFTAGEPVYPAGYFDEVVDIDDLAGTTEENLRTDQDFIAFGSEVVAVKTAAA